MNLLAYKIIILGLIIGSFFSYMIATKEEVVLSFVYLIIHAIISAISIGMIYTLLYFLGVL